jgi:hypothetical protein
MGGADVSLGTIAQSLAGLVAWRVNMDLWTSKEAEAHRYTSSLRTLYSDGGINDRALYDEIMSGKTNIEERLNGDYRAKTEAHGDGTKTMYLGKDALADGSRFGMNILLAHEAYRNGVDDGEAGQKQETQEAVVGHIHAALALSQVYGMGSIGEAMSHEVNAYLDAIKNGNYEALANVMGGYDASGDYWRLKTDGSIVWDGSKDLNIEYYDENGTIRIKNGHIKDTTGSFSQSLALYIGEERASQLLKSDLNNADLYDKQTIMDCLRVSELEAAAIQRKGKLPSNISDIQMQKLVGEALMKKSGMIWDNTKGWSSENGFKAIQLSDIKDIGQIIINKNNNGGFDRFAISGIVTRDENSYQSVRKQEGVSAYQGLDTMTLFKKDLNGNIIDSIFISGWQTVANGYATKYNGINTKKAFEVDDVYRGDTIAPDNYFSMRIGNFTHPDYDGFVFILNNARLMNNSFIGLDGGKPWRNLVHSYTKNNVVNSSYGLISAGCFINDAQKLNYIQKYVNNIWNINYPYDVKMIVQDSK